MKKTRSRPFQQIRFILLFMSIVFVIGFLPGIAFTKSIFVDDNAGPGGNGSSSAPFTTIGQAVQVAKAGDSIQVAPGVYEVTSTIMINKRLEIRGSNQMVLDQNGWPTGKVMPGTETLIVDHGVLVNQPVISVGALDGPVLFDVKISNVYVQGGFYGIQIMRTQNFTVEHCHISSPLFIGLRTGLSSGKISRNYITSAPAAGIIVEAGTGASPANVDVVDNRSVKNGGGFLASGSSPSPDFADFLDVVVQHNDFSENTTVPVQSFGLRIFMMHRDLVGAFGSQQTGNVRAVIQANRIQGNNTGVVMDAGFPYRRRNQICDTRVFSGSFDITLQSNDVGGSVFAPALITFTRNTASLNPQTLIDWQFLHATTFSIHDPEGALEGFLLDHPQRDPWIGTCPGDQKNETLGNRLIYNGNDVPYGDTVP